MQKVALLSKIALIFFLYLLTYYSYIGIKNPIPPAGDSFDYHIPISLTILNGDFLTLSSNTQIYIQGTFVKALHKFPQWYYPGSSEAINSIFMHFQIPLTLTNILAVIVLALSLYRLGKVFGLSGEYSLLFSLTFATLNGVVRWLNSVNIDIWVIVWLSWSLILLENPKKSLTYFAKLGFVLGMLIGSKLIALYLFITLIFLYFRKIFSHISPGRVISFILPFSLGLMWYVRNFALTGNPFYPVAIFGFNGPFYESQRIINQVISHPIEFFNAGFGEFHLWIASIVLAIFILAMKPLKRDLNLDGMSKLFIIGIVNLLFFLDFPSSSQPWILVSGMRYALPAFMCIILGTFIYFKDLGKEEFLGFFAIGNMITILSLVYYPKLIFIYLPVYFAVVYLYEKRGELLGKMSK